MGNAESRRLDLYNRLQEVLGTDPATTLMTYLPPVETEQLLTRTEFDEFKATVDKRFDNLDQKIDRVLLAVVGGIFVVVAAVIGTGALT